MKKSSCQYQDDLITLTCIYFQITKNNELHLFGSGYFEDVEKSDFREGIKRHSIAGQNQAAL
jgi:hypothetical protein